jgi:hypothetical protein
VSTATLGSHFGYVPFDAAPALGELERAQFAAMLERTIVRAPRPGMTPCGLIEVGDEVKCGGMWRAVGSIVGASGGRLHIRFTDGTEAVADRDAERHVRKSNPLRLTDKATA